MENGRLFKFTFGKRKTCMCFSVLVSATMALGRCKNEILPAKDVLISCSVCKTPPDHFKGLYFCGCPHGSTNCLQLWLRNALCLFRCSFRCNTASYYNCLSHNYVLTYETLHYKPEGRGFDSQWCHGIFH
jgi:hypothetical protein